MNLGRVFDIYLFVPYISEYDVSVPTEGPSVGCPAKHHQHQLRLL